MELDFSEPEEIISMLVNQHGVKINTIEKRLEMKRTEFMSMRRSTKSHTKKTLAEKIISAFPEYLSAANYSEPKTENKIEMKYIALLEKRLQEVEAERDKWKQLAEQKQGAQPPE